MAPFSAPGSCGQDRTALPRSRWSATRLRRVSGALTFTLVAASGCGDESPSFAPPPDVTVTPIGDVRVRREIVVLDGVVPPPNPKTGAATPPEQNRVRVVRYRVDATPPRPARAVVVMMPGFLAGAGSLDGLARAIVARSTEADALEAWAIDRRSNLLEDTHGLDVAEVRGDPAPAYAYYEDGQEVEGKTFSGFLTGPEAPWASEWGLATTLGDLANVIAWVPAEARKTRVVLLGHSLGASIVETYAAWDFGGRPGFWDVAALVLADGVARNEGDAPETVNREDYERGGAGGPFPTPGVETGIREGQTFVALPLLGTKALAVAEAVAIAARSRPAEVTSGPPVRDQLLSLVLGLAALPRLTNAAAFGFAFDEDSAILSFAAARCGAGTGGPITPYAGAFGGQLLQPSDPNATYGWVDGPDVGEPTRIADLARAWFEGPGLNFAEWYFPQRLPVDVRAAGTLTIMEDDWRFSVYGLRARFGAEIDLPIYAAPFRLVGDPSAYDKLRALVKTRPEAFVVKAYPELAHIDGLVGADVPGSAARIFYDDLVAFVRERTPPGGVVVP